MALKVEATLSPSQTPGIGALRQSRSWKERGSYTATVSHILHTSMSHVGKRTEDILQHFLKTIFGARLSKKCNEEIFSEHKFLTEP